MNLSACSPTSTNSRGRVGEAGFGVTLLMALSGVSSLDFRVHTSINGQIVSIPDSSGVADTGR